MIGGEVRTVRCRDSAGGTTEHPCRAAISSMPLRELIEAIDPPAPEAVRKAARRLTYRDFLTVVLVIDRAECFPDQWIYIHDPKIKLARVQNFKNWSAAMVPDPNRTVLGLEYFCFEGDSLWQAPDDELVRLGVEEIDRIGLARPNEVVEGTVIRVHKAYPVYDRSYRPAVETIRAWLAGIPNLLSAGRNAMHQYNNQDHSMMTALLAARNLLGADSTDPWMLDHEGEFSGRAVPRPLEKDRANGRSAEPSNHPINQP
jgi:protoporphyrinogen oxidase